MGANTSQRKAQAILLAAKVADYREWWLTIDCGSCGPRDIPLVTLLPEQTISQTLRRLRCASCRGEVASADLSNALPGWRGRRVRIWAREVMGEPDVLPSALIIELALTLLLLPGKLYAREKGCSKRLLN